MSKFSTFQSLAGITAISTLFTGFLFNNVKGVPALKVAAQSLTSVGLTAGAVWAVGSVGHRMHLKLEPLVRGTGISA